MKLITALFIFVVSVGTVLSQGSASPVRTVSKVDLNRYSGQWYEIARYPNKFQDDCVGNTTATYTLKGQGKVEVLNRCLEKDGTVKNAKGSAKVVDKSSNAKLKVRFAPSFLSAFGFVWGDYWVIDLGDNYEYSVVADRDRKYLWILSREPRISDGVYRGIIQRIEAQGFDAGRLIKTPQNGRS